MVLKTSASGGNPRWPSSLEPDEIVEIRRLLTATRDLIPTAARWTRNVFARDSRGREVWPDAPTAVRFCVSGALLAAIHDLHGVRIKMLAATPAGLSCPSDPVAEKAFAFLGFSFSLIEFDSRAVRAERTQLRFLPTATEESGEVVRYWLLPASINDASTHHHILSLLDLTLGFLGAIEERTCDQERTCGSEVIGGGDDGEA